MRAKSQISKPSIIKSERHFLLKSNDILKSACQPVSYDFIKLLFDKTTNNWIGKHKHSVVISLVIDKEMKNAAYDVVIC